MSKAGGTTTHYLYSADKTKLASRNTAGYGYDYLGSLEYKRTGGSLSLASASFDGGRIVVSDRIVVLPGGGGSLPGKGEIVVTPPATGGLTGADLSDVGLEAGDLPVLKPKKIYTPYYYLTDHLGSVRVIVDKAGNVKERNDYYAFGQRWENPSSIVSENKYLFNGKEKQPDFDFLDYGARMYDPGLGRWTSRDLMAENNVAHSPYAFCANNPVVNIDPDGQDWFSYMRYRYDENGKVIGGDRVYEYSTEYQSQADLDQAGRFGKYLGLTYTDEKNGVYYSLYGSAFFLRSPNDEWNLRGEMVRNIDNAIINSYKANFLNNNPVDPMYNEYHDGGTNMRIARVITTRNVSLAQQYRVFDYQGGSLRYDMTNNPSNAAFSWGDGKFGPRTGFNISGKKGVHATIDELYRDFDPVVWTFPDRQSWLEVRQKTDNLLKGRTW